MSFVDSLYELALEPHICTLDHRKSVAWLISNGPHSVAYCYPPPLVVPHPLSFPRGGWGTVTWSTQNFSLRLIVLLCG